MPGPGGPRDTSSTKHLPVIIIGAGMAGLTCAVEICKAGRDVLVLEATDGVGGRVRTDRHPEGFLLDRGFQVLLEAYPAVRRQINIDDLRPSAFDAGALVWTGKRLIPLADPFRHPRALIRDLSTPVLSKRDKLLLASTASRTLLADWQTASDADGDRGDGLSAAEVLFGAGFSRKFVDCFARPFWGGILLDRSLSTSAGALYFTLKMFLEGNGVLPAEGMQAMPELLAHRLPLGAIRVNRAVDEIVTENACVTAVRVGSETIPATDVVVATDPITARRLTGLSTIPDGAVGCTTVYLTGAGHGNALPPLGRRLTLDGTGTLAVNHLAPLSTVAPTYAPSGKHLLAAVFLGEWASHPDDDVLATLARDDAATMMGHTSEAWRPLATVRTPFAQYAQPPGVYGSLPNVTTPTTGLYLAGEATVDSSYNGAIRSGEQAAAAVLQRSKAESP